LLTQGLDPPKRVVGADAPTLRNSMNR